MAKRNATFPRMTISNWWELRKEAQKSPDLLFTPENISSLLNISIPTVHVNVLPALRLFEIIDKDGALTDRGRRWLNDGEYKDLCMDVLESIYPIELLTLVSEHNADREVLKKWFLEKTSSPMNSVLQMTATFLLLYNGNLPGETPEERPSKKSEPDKLVRRVIQRPSVTTPPVLTEPDDQPDEDDQQDEDLMAEEPVEQKTEPVLEQHAQAHKAANPVINAGAVLEGKSKSPVSINIDLVITNDTPAELIDALFASIARHMFVS